MNFQTRTRNAVIALASIFTLAGIVSLDSCKSNANANANANANTGAAKPSAAQPR